LKDYQQCLVLKKMAADLNLDVEIVPCPTVREHDGRAMSSRNAYLSPEERLDAPLMYKALKDAGEAIKDGTLKIADTAPRLRRALAAANTLTEIQYASAYDPETLDEATEGRRILIAAAVKIGDTRLIDNIMVEL
jgi:pantoate--beta-alanine ligase